MYGVLAKYTDHVGDGVLAKYTDHVGDGVLDIPLKQYQLNFRINALTLALSRWAREFLAGMVSLRSTPKLRGANVPFNWFKKY